MLLRLAASRPGRLTLHFLCALRDRRLRWHARGIARELTELLTRHECPALVGGMAGLGGKSSVCVRQDPPKPFPCAGPA